MSKSINSKTVYHFKMAYFCSFSLGGNVDFLQKKFSFYNIDHCWRSNVCQTLQEFGNIFLSNFFLPGEARVAREKIAKLGTWTLIEGSMS